MKTDIEFIPYGEISTRLASNRWPTMSQRARVSKSWHTARHDTRRIFIAFSQDLDKSFVEMFRKRTAENSRLLIFNEGLSTDRLVSRIVDLQIRTPQRFYVIDGCGKTAFLLSVLKRLNSAHETEDSQERILDAKIDDGVLHVVSANFIRLDVPIAKIPEFKNQEMARIQEFEIDEDGAFIYWPKSDVHLGWSQLQQLINPVAALKASQKSREFNKRYGGAVLKIREQARLKPSDIIGISEKQLRRIETGECRLTSNAIEALSKAHKLTPNEYMKKLAAALN